ncbi:MAG TPA: AMIN domain-containing protein [Desulfuromonadales bacterium]|nr:AMIN domain-containing protein [Desulfuromonadales bacterium]
MKKAFIVMLLITLSGGMRSTLFAAELLDVKPILAGNSVSVQISADSAMTYTYYNVPGQPRAVVDIAEADPEKIEPLIVVNKGEVSSISVDNIQISGIVASRIIFNLFAESAISVTASSDRKLLMVTFSTVTPAAGIPELKNKSMPEEIKPAVVSEPVTAVSVTTAAVPLPAALPEKGPLGLDEPAVHSVDAPAQTATAAAPGAPALSAVPAATRSLKLEPVVPATTAPARSPALKIKEIVTALLSVEIHTNQPVPDFKTMKLSSPDRLVIDIPCNNTDQRPYVTAINKFGIAKIRVGVSPQNIRIVLDSSKTGFPAHTITKTAYGLRINFK